MLKYWIKRLLSGICWRELNMRIKLKVDGTEYIVDVKLKYLFYLALIGTPIMFIISYLYIGLGAVLLGIFGLF